MKKSNQSIQVINAVSLIQFHYILFLRTDQTFYQLLMTLDSKIVLYLVTQKNYDHLYSTNYKQYS